jgi:cell division septation protein DedD
MTSGRTGKSDEKGLSVRYLVVVFLMGVAACAVFFSLGFLVGYNERPGRGSAATEEVVGPTMVPPLVNPPRETGEGGSSAAAPASREPEAERVTGPAAIPDTQSAPPAPAKETRAARPAETRSGFTVQVIASSEQRDAQRVVDELKSRGYAVFLVKPQDSGLKDNLYRVQVGPFSTREEAERVRNRLVADGFKPFIRQ